LPVKSHARSFGSTPPFGTTDKIVMTVTHSQFDLLSKLVDVTAMRHRVLAQNVANVNTPGYQRLAVSFDDTLAARLDRDGDKRLNLMKPEIVVDDSTPERLDGNSVDIDREMMRINKNQLLNNTLLQIVSTKSSMMRRAISGQ
jgi:flagellar basal-body rod protein FlgB